MVASFSILVVDLGMHGHSVEAVATAQMRIDPDFQYMKMGQLEPEDDVLFANILNAQNLLRFDLSDLPWDDAVLLNPHGKTVSFHLQVHLDLFSDAVSGEPSEETECIVYTHDFVQASGHDFRTWGWVEQDMVWDTRPNERWMVNRERCRAKSTFSVDVSGQIRTVLMRPIEDGRTATFSILVPEDDQTEISMFSRFALNDAYRPKIVIRIDHSPLMSSLSLLSREMWHVYAQQRHTAVRHREIVATSNSTWMRSIILRVLMWLIMVSAAVGHVMVLRSALGPKRPGGFGGLGIHR